MKHQSHRVRRSVAALAVTLAGGASALGLASATAAHAATTTTAVGVIHDLHVHHAGRPGRPDVQPAAGDQRPQRDRRLLRLRRGRGTRTRATCSTPPYGQANYTERELPRLGADPGHRARTTRATPPGSGSTATAPTTGSWSGTACSTRSPTPRPRMMAGSVNQLLGINDNGVAVGLLQRRPGPLARLRGQPGHRACSPPSRSPATVSAQPPPGSTTCGDIAGFATDAAGTTTGWLLHSGHLTTYQFPGGSDTQAFGINDHDQIVGSYLDGAGVHARVRPDSPARPGLALAGHR